jgi:CelD/BcsL family acetyltransferase involved in cellulose biosynthesis
MTRDAMEISDGDDLTTGVCNSLEALRSAGLDISHLSRGNSLEARPEWFELLHRAVFANDSGVRYHYLAHGKKVTALLPIRRTGRIVRKIEALGNFYTSLYMPLLSDESNSTALHCLLAQIASERDGAHVMRFAPMDLESPVFHELQDRLKTLGWKTFRFFCFGNWYLKVEKDWDIYLKHRSANLRSRIKRKTRHFIEEGGTLEIISSPERVDEAIQAYQEVYSASWKIPEFYSEFIPALIRCLASSGALRMGIARLKGQAVAAQLWIVMGDTASIYKLAYHEAFSAYSPGTVLTAHLLRHVIDHDRVAEVDYLIGDDEYKKDWMSDRRERWGIIAYNPRTFLGAVLAVRETAARNIKPARIWARSLFGKIRPKRRLGNHD